MWPSSLTDGGITSLSQNRNVNLPAFARPPCRRRSRRCRAPGRIAPATGTLSSERLAVRVEVARECGVPGQAVLVLVADDARRHVDLPRCETTRAPKFAACFRSWDGEHLLRAGRPAPGAFRVAVGGDARLAVSLVAPYVPVLRERSDVASAEARSLDVEPERDPTESLPCGARRIRCRRSRLRWRGSRRRPPSVPGTVTEAGGMSPGACAEPQQSSSQRRRRIAQRDVDVLLVPRLHQAERGARRRGEDEGVGRAPRR